MEARKDRSGSLRCTRSLWHAYAARRRRRRHWTGLGCPYASLGGCLWRECVQGGIGDSRIGGSLRSATGANEATGRSTHSSIDSLLHGIKIR